MILMGNQNISFGLSFEERKTDKEEEEKRRRRRRREEKKKKKKKRRKKKEFKEDQRYGIVWIFGFLYGTMTISMDTCFGL